MKLSEHILNHESVEIIEDQLFLHINMAGLPLPEGECEDFVEFFTPVIENYIEHICIVLK